MKIIIMWEKVMKWDKYRGNIYARKGGWEIGKGIMTHGYSLLDDIHGKCSMFQLMIMNVTGKLPEKRLADMLEGFFICMSWPDPRIWCNKMGVFSAQTKSFVTAAIAAGGLAGDSKIYGPGSGRTVGPFMRLAHQSIVEKKISVGEFIQLHGYRRGKLYAPGFARPLARGDERVPAMRELAERLGYQNGEYMEMANKIEAYLEEKEGESLNLAGYFAAFMMDQGFTDEQIMGVTAISVTGGVYAAYFEYVDQSPNTFLPLKVTDIEYIGPATREVPDK
jgi:citrate synthase